MDIENEQTVNVCELTLISINIFVTGIFLKWFIYFVIYSKGLPQYEAVFYQVPMPENFDGLPF